ncbi:MAG: aminotransferase class I/II-fold pyridoxal phosphate-dependent enzyme [Rhodospirillales bacterium]|nr:aminotransferase class I/II-fold pyridoxal phosphate-dependent enzyme [Rhodospirillales bacterium]
MALKVSKRGQVAPFIVMDVLLAAHDLEAEGASIMHMEIGQPGTGAPKGVIEAAKKALDTKQLGYTESFGIPELRSAIRDHYIRTYGVYVPLERIAVTTGSSGAFVLSFIAAFEAGDTVAMASPGYPAYRNILTALDIEVVEIPVGPDTNFQPSPELLAECGETLDGLIVASPSNPAGTMIDPAGLKDLYDYCQEHGIRLISDEIYHGITYVDPAETMLRFGDDAVIINSFSKYFSMTGWRLGWMVLPPDLVDACERLAPNLFISAPAVSQHAAVAVFDCEEELQENLVKYRENRELLLRELPKAGFSKLASVDGGFYVYADVSELTNDSASFCEAMLKEAGVAATPGTDFDPKRGHLFVRFSFARDPADMAEAAKRLIEWRNGSN